MNALLTGVFGVYLLVSALAVVAGVLVMLRERLRGRDGGSD